MAWLAKEKNVDTNLPVRDYELQSRFGDLPFLHAAAVAVLDAAGLDGLARRLDAWGGLDAWSVSILTVCWPFGTLPAPN